MISSQSQYTGFGMGFGTLSLSTGGLPAFKFRSRHESIDWRRFSALDVERVARELDVSTLQENIMSVTFCNLDSERCPCCQNLVDPVLLKVFKLAQLNTEYLLHSQEFFTSNIQALEEQLQLALEELENSRQEIVKKTEELKAAKEESRRRKKMIATLQLLVQAGANNYHKCQLCDKAFVNYSFLQGHVERRHPEITQAERKTKQQTEQIVDEIEELRERLRISQSQLEVEREADSLRRGQELENTRRREEELRKEFETWKEEERKKIFREMESLRQQLLTEFQDMASKNLSIEAKLQEIQSRSPVISKVETFHEKDQTEELRNLREKFEKLKKESKKKLKELQAEHVTEQEEMRTENERLRSTLSADQRTTAEYFQKQINTLSAKVKEQSAVILSQENQIKDLSSRPIQAAAMSQDSESEKDDDLESTLDRKQQLLDTLRQNPKFIKQFRPILEESLEEKLENMGLKKGSKGISAQTMKSMSLTVGKQRESKAKHFHEFTSLRKRFAKIAIEKVKEKQCSEGYISPPPRSVTARRRTSSSPKAAANSKRPRAVLSKPSRVIDSKFHQTEVSKPAAQHRAASPSHSAALSASTPPFSSDDDSIVDSAYVTSVGVKDAPKVSIIQSKQKQSQATMSDDDDWSDTDISTGVLSPPAASTVRSPPGTMVQSMARTLEKQLSSSAKKPTGGVKLLPAPQAALRTSPKNSTVVKKLQLSDDEESELDISSIEDVSEEFAPKVRTSKPVPVPRQSTEPSFSQGTSVWSSLASRGAGQKEAIMSTSLKSSSFATVTDISDSELNFP
ncbi:cilium assembly protein DZIP1L-like [Pristis pectinata]|uniref:cilium assembly protein DZIP1L-like n=1 Tax=Pristis pectinata TaxID=685728 RepID=UPI00223E783F|nr:cilium assembly protein DZIP1L-like [Pristis pectinata]XP_051873830.1 cilium assembly protein DZIP1L-like [Pristis pectinata]XP_051873831.1 cilium assembly protein DZIP1L-like [Pristis pectinata]XP_051873832.1 cilium assembly protein DZIP1L-like [Pristis pectinata]XP_051873833.1 cilium assembly protein DZIP1L-like [Pristis pectinata]